MSRENRPRRASNMNGLVLRWLGDDGAGCVAGRTVVPGERPVQYTRRARARPLGPILGWPTAACPRQLG